MVDSLRDPDVERLIQLRHHEGVRIARAPFLCHDARAVPTYDYQCRACGTVTEVIHSMQEDGPSVCELCGGELRRVLFPSGIIFKGSGLLPERLAGEQLRQHRADPRPAAGPVKSEGAGAEKKSGSTTADGGTSGTTTAPSGLELDLGRLGLARAASAAEARIRRER